jgi:alanine dehydrogenase
MIEPATVAMSPRKEVVSRADAFDAVEKVFAAMARAMPTTSPSSARPSATPTRSMASSPASTGGQGVLGVKSGGYWPGNMTEGADQPPVDRVPVRPRHRPAVKALVGGNFLTAVRTAAASSVSIRTWRGRTPRCSAWSAPAIRRSSSCAPPPRRTPSRRSSPGTMHPEMLPKLGEVAEELGLPFEAVEREALGARPT